MSVTKKDLETFKAIENQFSDTLINDHYNGNREAALQEFSKNTSLGEKASIMYSRLRFNFADQANPENAAKHLLAYCDKSVPALTKAFGRHALVHALPDEAKTPRVADLAETLGAKHIPALIREALDNAPS